MLLFIGALVSQPGIPDARSLHTPLDRASTAARVFVDCLVDQARTAARGRAAPSVALAVARRRCRAEERALDDVHRAWQRSQGRAVRGVSRAEVRRLVDEAALRVAAERGALPRQA